MMGLKDIQYYEYPVIVLILVIVVIGIVFTNGNTDTETEEPRGVLLECYESDCTVMGYNYTSTFCVVIDFERPTTEVVCLDIDDCATIANVTDCFPGEKRIRNLTGNKTQVLYIHECKRVV